MSRLGRTSGVSGAWRRTRKGEQQLTDQRATDSNTQLVQSPICSGAKERTESEVQAQTEKVGEGRAAPRVQHGAFVTG